MNHPYRLNRRIRHNIRRFLENTYSLEFVFLQRRRLVTAKEVSKKYPNRLLLLLDQEPAPLEKQIEFSWNPSTCSPNLVLQENQLTVERSHIEDCTDGVRGKVGVSEGLHVWEVHWPTRKRGSNSTVGVVTASAPLTSLQYVNLIGGNKDSWGWDIVNCKAVHDMFSERENTTYPVFDDIEEKFKVPSTFFIVLDMDAGTLSYIVDGEYLGVAFSGLKGKVLYPAIGCIWGGCEVTLRYIGGMANGVSSLKDICRCYIRENIPEGQNIDAAIDSMTIPEELKTYMKYGNKDNALHTRVLKTPVEEEACVLMEVD